MAKLPTSRRQALKYLTGGLGAIASTYAWPRTQAAGVVSRVDHLILGVPDLETGIIQVERLTGVRAEAGGSHPGRGTRNALMSLGDACYFEIIAPDPAQSVFDFPIDLRELNAPRLVNWAVSGDVEVSAENLRQASEGMIGPRDGSRMRPDGRELQWKTLHVERRLGSSEVEPVPFMIEWARGTVHPSDDSPVGCTLKRLEIFHPDPQQLDTILNALCIEIPVRAGATRLRAVLDTPKGSITIS